MFAVRQAFSQPPVLARIVENLIAQGLVDEDALDTADPLRFVVDEGHAASLTEAAY